MASTPLSTPPVTLPRSALPTKLHRLSIILPVCGVLLLPAFLPLTLPRYNPKQKGHCPPQNTPSKSPKYHNILCFFSPRISLAVSPFPSLTAKYSQSRFHTVFPRFFPPFKLPVSAPLLRGFYSRNLPTHKGSPIAFLTAIY